MCIRDSYNTLMLCHGVDVGSNQCGIRWYELRDANDGNWACLLYTSDAADERSSVDLGGRRIIKKKKTTKESDDGCV